MFGNRCWGYLLCLRWLGHLRRGSSLWCLHHGYLGLPGTGLRLGTGQLGRRQASSHHITTPDHHLMVSFSGGMSSGKIVPEVRLLIILRDTLAILVHHPKIILGVGLALVGRFAVPVPCLRVILWDALPVIVT